MAFETLRERTESCGKQVCYRVGNPTDPSWFKLVLVENDGLEKVGYCPCPVDKK